MTDYDIIYHRGFTGRAAPVIHLLIEAGLTYTLVAPTWGADRCATPNPGHPVFAPPVLKKGDFHLAQTCAILQYLGAKHGFTPSDPELAASCLQASMDSADVLVEISNQIKSEDKGVAFLSEGGRLSIWMEHFARIISKHGGPFLYGAEPKFADFHLFAILSALSFCFPSFGTDRLPENLRAFYEAFEARPSTIALKGLGMPALPESMRT